MTAPFTKLARSDARNTISSAISSGAAARPRGMGERIAADASPTSAVPGVLCGRAGEAAGVVAEMVVAGGAFGERAGIGGRSEVGAHNLSRAARRFDCRDHFGAARLTAAADQGMRSLAREGLCGRAADAGGSTGNQRSPSTQPTHARFSS